MRQLKIRYARPEEGEQILVWMKANQHNHFDPRILKYPTLRMLCSYSDDGPVCYLPVHNVLMMESIAVNPVESPFNVAQALRDLTKGSELIADAGGMREVYFLGGHGGVGSMAAENGKHSFERVVLGEKPAEAFRVIL